VSAPGLTPVEPAVPAGRMYAALVGIGAVCGLLIVSAFVLTKPTIERKKAEALERAIFEVLPGAVSSAPFRRLADGRFERAEKPQPGEALVYAAYDGQGALVGLALEAESMGYGDLIHMLYGYSIENQAIVGVKVLESKETPGLGDRIESDAGFRENFRSLDARLAEDGEALAHPIVTVKHGEKQNPWEIDGITGATISSKAVGRALDASAARWLPDVRQHLDDFRRRE
jgi:electron transport complex protein RnfG